MQLARQFLTRMSDWSPLVCTIYLLPYSALDGETCFCLDSFRLCCVTGRSSADIIAGRLQDSQAKELRSFAVLNLAWSSIIRLLLVLANLPEQPRLAQSMSHHSTGVPSLLLLLMTWCCCCCYSFMYSSRRSTFAHTFCQDKCAPMTCRLSSSASAAAAYRVCGARL